MRNFGVEFTFARLDNKKKLEGAIRPNTRMIWLETPSNPLTEIYDIAALSAREQTAAAYSAHPALLRLQELETLRELARTANARIYINFDKAVQPGDEKE